MMVVVVVVIVMNDSDDTDDNDDDGCDDDDGRFHDVHHSFLSYIHSCFLQCHPRDQEVRRARHCWYRVC